MLGHIYLAHLRVFFGGKGMRMFQFHKCIDSFIWFSVDALFPFSLK